MSASHSSSALAGFIAEATVTVDVGVRNRGNGVQALRDGLDHRDTEENGLRQRARRRGLALMVASCVLSILVLYGIWTLLSGVI